MKDAEIRELVDKGRSIKEKIDALDTELNSIKKTLREEAKEKKVNFFIGNKHFTRISPDSTTTCDPEELQETMREMGMEAEYYDCVKVLVGKAKDYMGATAFDDISHTTSEPYKKVSFLAKAPKKYLE